jgi:predicted ester cyclase
LDIKELAQKYTKAVEEAYYRGNLDPVDDLYHTDVVIHQPPFPDIVGLEAYKQNIMAARQAFTDIRFNWEEMVGEGKTMAFRSTWHMKHTGVSAKLPVPPTGKEVVMKGGLFISVRNGRIIEIFEYKDYLGLFRQLGVIRNQ